jgi:hypothetical protein
MTSCYADQLSRSLGRYRRLEGDYIGAWFYALCAVEPGRLYRGIVKDHGRVAVFFDLYGRKWDLLQPHSRPLSNRVPPNQIIFFVILNLP